MLVVTVEVWPWGREERKYKIGEITAANISNGRIATYEVRVHCDGYEPEGLPAIDEEFLLRDHDRSAGALALIRDALLVTIPLPEEGDGASDAGPGSISPDVREMDKHPGSPNSGSAARTAIARFAPANRRRLSGAGLRTFLAIADLWSLTEEQRRLILGYPARSTYRGWVKKAREHRDITLSVDALMRISAILGIYKGLRILFADDDEGVTWLRTPPDARILGGGPPIDLMISGTQDALLTVRRLIDAARGGLYRYPTSDERDWPPDDDSEIKFVGMEDEAGGSEGLEPPTLGF